ncbi:hypothetical protein [Nissabacter archeti]|uniref:hypothetical protein n=1 Tax=Nissabacter archeti TaxID=1917880 RepID=UPI0009337050|nr:hypothetical protein [Nissabacter archeti]
MEERGAHVIAGPNLSDNHLAVRTSGYRLTPFIGMTVHQEELMPDGRLPLITGIGLCGGPFCAGSGCSLSLSVPFIAFTAGWFLS